MDCFWSLHSPLLNHFCILFEPKLKFPFASSLTSERDRREDAENPNRDSRPSRDTNIGRQTAYPRRKDDNLHVSQDSDRYCPRDRYPLEESPPSYFAHTTYQDPGHGRGRQPERTQSRVMSDQDVGTSSRVRDNHSRSPPRSNRRNLPAPVPTIKGERFPRRRADAGRQEIYSRSGRQEIRRGEDYRSPTRRETLSASRPRVWSERSSFPGKQGCGVRRFSRGRYD